MNVKAVPIMFHCYQGDQGEQGEKGSYGPAGSPGLPGEPGRDGLTGLKGQKVQERLPLSTNEFDLCHVSRLLTKQKREHIYAVFSFIREIRQQGGRSGNP